MAAVEISASALTKLTLVVLRPLSIDNRDGARLREPPQFLGKGVGGRNRGTVLIVRIARGSLDTRFRAIEEMMEQLVGINEAASHGAIRPPAAPRARQQ